MDFFWIWSDIVGGYVQIQGRVLRQTFSPYVLFVVSPCQKLTDVLPNCAKGSVVVFERSTGLVVLKVGKNHPTNLLTEMAKQRYETFTEETIESAIDNALEKHGRPPYGRRSVAATRVVPAPEVIEAPTFRFMRRR